MTLMLGIDTGGTFTDAVIVDEGDHGRVVASAKAPTTHGDLAIGVAEAVEQVLGAPEVSATADIKLASVSTTLATNALVEGHGEPAALLTFGFNEKDLARTGIGATIDADLIVRFVGGHDAHGNEREPLDVEHISAVVRELEPRVSAFAVAAQFSVRNSAHELQVTEIIQAITDKPVTSSHELSAQLNGPRRALTAALNARLIGTIVRLNDAVRRVLDKHALHVPLMVVRGDGSLVSADFAARRPIETVLSGPAASVIGALHLAGVQDGLVVDIGGTTTDVAVVHDGRPRLAAGGAVVGGYQTMVEAVDMATTGIGGDSEVRIDSRVAAGPLVLGPERAIPLSRLATEHPEIHSVLDQQLAAAVNLGNHARFYVATGSPSAITDERERRILDQLAGGPKSVNSVAANGLAVRAALRLRSRGLIRVATMTPTDASAVLGDLGAVDRDAAVKAAKLLARQSRSDGKMVAADAHALSAMVIDKLERASADFVLRAALENDGIRLRPGDDSLIEAALDDRGLVSSVSIGVARPLTAIGAPASAYYQAVAKRLGTTVVVPEHAEVANAIGAVVGQVRIRRTATVTQPSKGQFRVHLDDQPTFGSVERARDHAIQALTASVLAAAKAAGAATPELTTDWKAISAEVAGKDVFVEATLTIEASGRPGLG